MVKFTAPEIFKMVERFFMVPSNNSFSVYLLYDGTALSTNFLFDSTVQYRHLTSYHWFGAGNCWFNHNEIGISNSYVNDENLNDNN
jgi:hypothetical protein